MTLNGLTLAALYFVVASGFSLIFGLMRTVNMADGTRLLIGAYGGYLAFGPLHDSDNPLAWYAGLGAGILAAAAAGVLLQIGLLGWMQGRSCARRWSPSAFRSSPPTSCWRSSAAWPCSASRPMRCAAPPVQIGVTLAVGIGRWLLLNATRIGLMIRAGVDDRAMLVGLGVNVPLVNLAVFVLGAGLAGLAGGVGGSAQPFGPGADVSFLISLLVVVIVGGRGSMQGTALGALLVGMAEQWGQAVAPIYPVILSFAMTVCVLAVRPQGLLARAWARTRAHSPPWQYWR